MDACDDDAIDEAAATEGDADDPAVTTRNRHSAWANMHDVRSKTTRVARVCPSLVSRLLLGAKADLCFENFEDEGTDAFGAFVDARGSGSKGKKKKKKKGKSPRSRRRRDQRPRRGRETKRDAVHLAPPPAAARRERTVLPRRRAP